jgi:hypothetical protein
LPLADHRITNLNSFDTVTKGKANVAGLYFYDVLGNPLIDVAMEVSRDFFGRPQIFTNPGNPAVAPLLAKLSAQMGSNEQIPSREQRAAIFTPIFGELSDWSGKTDFPRLRDELVQAAAAYAERSFNTGVEMLRERVRQTHRPFKEYLTGFDGASLDWSRTKALPQVTEKLSFSILRSQAVSSAYGIPAAPQNIWPYAEDANGDKLIEEISKRAASASAATTTASEASTTVTSATTTANGPTTPPSTVTTVLTRELFLNLQREALRGAEAIATIIDFTEAGSTPADLDRLITKVYSWGAALHPAHWTSNGSQQASALPPEMAPMISR